MKKANTFPSSKCYKVRNKAWKREICCQRQFKKNIFHCKIWNSSYIKLRPTPPQATSSHPKRSQLTPPNCNILNSSYITLITKPSQLTHPNPTHITPWFPSHHTLEWTQTHPTPPHHIGIIQPTHPLQILPVMHFAWSGILAGRGICFS